MRRREFLLSLPGAAQAAPAVVPGSVLAHEHVLVDFAGVKSTAAYDRGEVLRIARPKVEEAKRYGCVRLLEATPQGLGRDARLLAMLAEAARIEIWTNTGIYGAAGRAGVPEWAWRATPRELAQRWVAEWKNGVEGLKPRFLKTAVHAYPLDELDRRLIQAAAIASLETGLTVASHTNGGGRAAEAQIEIFDKAGCPPDKFVWVHAQNEKDHAFHGRAARAGAWVEFDGISRQSAAWHLECVEFMRERRLLHRTLISQDAGWYHVGEPGGGQYRGYTFIYTDFLPLLPADARNTLMVENPRAAFGGK